MGMHAEEVELRSTVVVDSCGWPSEQASRICVKD